MELIFLEIYFSSNHNISYYTIKQMKLFKLLTINAALMNILWFLKQLQSMLSCINQFKELFWQSNLIKRIL